MPFRVLLAGLSLQLAVCHSLVFGVGYHVERLTGDLHIPVAAVMAPGIDDKIFIAQLGGTTGDGSDGNAITKAEGRIVVYDRTTGAVDYLNPYLVIGDTSLHDPFGVPEVGLFTMAFHPDFQTNGKFYVNVAVNHTGAAPIVDTRVSPFKTTIREYTADVNDPNLAIVSSRTILELNQPAANHNGSWIGFSPAETDQGKNYLYITQGDGGDQHDPVNYAQNKDSWFGKVMRIDVDGDDFPADNTKNYAVPADNPFVGQTGADEVWAYGLRNPWRASFDRLTSDLWIGDVGQGRYEEVDFQPASSMGGENYGWRLREGLHATPTGGVGGPPPPGNVDPVYEYVHLHLPGDSNFKGNSVTGGYVYRGPIDELYGNYIFADNVSGHIWSFDPSDPFGTVELLDDLLTPDQQVIFAVSSFGEDEAGNLLIVDGAGALFQVVDGTRSDFNYDGSLNIGDWLIFSAHHLADLSALSAQEQYRHGDLDFDGDNDFLDFRIFKTDFDAANGLGAFTAMVSVPEPSAIALASMVCFAGLFARQGSRSKCRCV
jgi:hypothetical protein